jgi:transcriptional regulator with XRE-family HTH domain
MPAHPPAAKPAPILAAEQRDLPRPSKTIVLAPTIIGERLREARLRRDMSQGDLAKALGTKQSNVSDIERGARGVTVQQLVKICRVLKTTPDQVLGEPKKTPDNGRFKDRRFVRRLQQIEALPKRKKQALLTTLDEFLKGAGAAE